VKDDRIATKFLYILWKNQKAAPVPAFKSNPVSAVISEPGQKKASKLPIFCHIELSARDPTTDAPARIGTKTEN
jgi:hypothetical protein